MLPRPLRMPNTSNRAFVVRSRSYACTVAFVIAATSVAPSVGIGSATHQACVAETQYVLGGFFVCEWHRRVCALGLHAATFERQVPIPSRRCAYNGSSSAGHALLHWKRGMLRGDRDTDGRAGGPISRRFSAFSARLASRRSGGGTRTAAAGFVVFCPTR